MTDTRSRDILNSYGADPARWPADERIMVEAALAADPQLRREQEAAHELDLMLAAWATRPVGSGDAGAAAVRVLRPPVSRRWWQVAASGGIAAALGALVMLAGPTTTAVSPPTSQVAAAVTDQGAFATVFTTTPDEESVL